MRMQVFVAYGYNERDKWIEELVFPLIEAFGCRIATGKVMYGQALSAEVQDAIRECDALMAFLTRRDKTPEGRWTTHQWVIDELTMAVSLGAPVVEVQEDGVEVPAGWVSSRQQIFYREDAREKALVQVAQAVSRLREQTSHRSLKLGPQEFVDEIRPLLTNSDMRCVYKVIRGNKESAWKVTSIRRLAGNLYVSAQGVKDDDFLQIRIQRGDQAWSSDFERVDDISISVRQE